MKKPTRGEHFGQNKQNGMLANRVKGQGQKGEKPNSNALIQPIMKSSPDFTCIHLHPSSIRSLNMKLYTLIAFLASSGIHAATLSPQDKHPVPGNTDFHYCDSHSANAPWRIKDLTLSPKHPKK